MFKFASPAVRSYAMAGRLYYSQSGWVLLSVPNDFVKGAFASLDEPGVELPPSPTGQLQAHISVMNADEVEKIGGPEKIRERGQTFHYSLDNLATVKPQGWKDVKTAWIIRVRSPELLLLRRSYGLGPPKYPFHITIAARRAHALRAEPQRKAAAERASPAERSKSASDELSRAFAAQLYARGLWDSQKGLAGNLVGHAEGTRRKLQQFERDQQQLAAGLAAENPELARQQFIRAMSGEFSPSQLPRPYKSFSSVLGVNLGATV